ncbi:MAG: hypothetical protein H6819_01065 [Phycisphaerales bacterium]|nr:hypothetical protein [Phycisphaerales bacterium]MCB9857202.1 hypothetical protein [Phycisphaerales bacterium]MCB9863085.1 hypothetical protein [Phycisphaerales bacterium]
MEPWTIEQFAEILAARGQVATTDDRPQRFLHELEIQTHRDFLGFNPQLTESQKVERRALVRRTCDCLIRRINSRLSDEGEIDTPPSDDVHRISQIFELAAEPLGGSIATGEALLDFASGALGHVVHFTHEGKRHPYRISEPDSGFIFLFAEFGLAANALGLPFWTNRLLLDLIKMQRYFLERNAHQRPRPWLQYRQPDRQLAPAARRRIDREFAVIAETSPTVARLEALMQANLIFATSNQRSVPQQESTRTTEVELIG